MLTEKGNNILYEFLVINAEQNKKQRKYDFVSPEPTWKQVKDRETCLTKSETTITLIDFKHICMILLQDFLLKLINTLLFSHVQVQYATIHAYAPKGTRFKGGYGNLSIWNPFVANAKDQSSSSLLVSIDSGSTFLMAGWIVSWLIKY